MQPSVLVADDDEGARELYKKFFANEGWKVQLVADGARAIDAAASQDFDIVVTDLVMPGINGYDVVRSLRTSNPQQPIIVVTGSACVQDVIDSMRCGASDILLKPIDYHALRESVYRIVNSMRQTPEAEDKSFSRYLSSDKMSFEVDAVSLSRVKFHAPVIDRLCRAGRYDNVMRLKLHLAVQEALSNSLDHGVLGLQSAWKDEFDEVGVDNFSRIKSNRLSDPAYAKQKIYINTTFEKRRLSIVIRDPGKGFLLKDRAQNDPDNRALRCHGRGLAIIAGTMDEVSYQHDGAEITMVKYLLE